MIRALMLASMLLGHGAQAQEAVAQCTGPCLTGQGPPDSLAYGDCSAPGCAMRRAFGPGGPPGWTVTAQPGGGVYGAEISLDGRSLGYLCRPSGPALVALKGLGGGASELIFQVDGTGVEAPFVTQDGVHYGPAEPGSALLDALMRGRQVVAVAGQITVSFPLEGSRAAIGQAMARCGLS